MPDEEKRAAAENLDIPPIFVTIPESELEQVKQERDEYKDKYIRLLADVDNMRKRSVKERQELVQYTTQNVIVEFLNPIDQLEIALHFTQQLSDEMKQWAFGFQMILNQFKDIMANHGVTAFHSKGQPFDPHCHEAIEMIVTTEYPPGTVMEENLRGYKMGNRVIRPARVKVAKAPEQPSPISQNGVKPNEDVC